MTSLIVGWCIGNHDRMVYQTPEQQDRSRWSQPIFDLPPVVTTFVLVLICIHLARTLMGEDLYIYTEAVFSIVPAKLTGTFRESLPGEAYWNFLSYAFIHGNWPHVLFNCLWAMVFGSVVARRLGTVRFLVLSAISAVVGGSAMLYFYWGEVVPIMGASAAVFGQTAAVIPLMYGIKAGRGPTMRGNMKDVIALSPRRVFADSRALLFMVVILGITLVTGSSSLLPMGEGASVAWQAHIGGFIAGLIVFYVLDKGPVL